MGREKLQKFVFILLLVLLPTQLGKHFWPEWSYINGIRVDYFSPTLYVTDLLILLLFVLEIQNSKFKIQNYELKVKSLLICCVTGLLIYLNVTHSLSPYTSLYKWLKVSELAFLAYWISKNSHTFLPFSFPALLLIPIFYESVLAIWQFVSQSSIGGFWYFFGERTFRSSTPGIANAAINGQLILRPYGTFPHPNVLAGFLIVSFPTVFPYLPHIPRRITAAILVLSVVALLLTFSRSALLGFVRFEPESWGFRGQLNEIAVKRWTQSPILGTGLGTSPLYSVNNELRIKNYALAFQPTHNIYLLLLSETGLLGLLPFLYLIIKMFRHLLLIDNYSLLISLGSILILGMFDHYFLTLQQGQLLFAIILGLSWGLARNQKLARIKRKSNPPTGEKSF